MTYTVDHKVLTKHSKHKSGLFTMCKVNFNRQSLHEEDYQISIFTVKLLLLIHYCKLWLSGRYIYIFQRNILLNLTSLLSTCAYREYCWNKCYYLVVTYKRLYMPEMDKILHCKANTDYEDSYTVSIQSHIGYALGSVKLRNHR